MLTYRDVLERYDRAKAFGETRDLPTYSRDMNDLYGTDEFSQGQRDGWWTRASTRADQFLEQSVVGDAFGALGRGVGETFGYGAEGEKIARQTPRGILNTLPLFLAEAVTGGAATPAIIAGTLGTGAAFGAHTYAETGSPRAALISGTAGAVMPGAGRLGGTIAKRLVGSPLARGLLTEEGAASGLFGQKAAGDFVSNRIASSVPEFLGEYAGSQLGMVGVAAGSAKLQNPDEDVLSKDFAANFLLGQIPFTVHDVYRGAKQLGRGLPTRERVAGFAKPEEVKAEGKPFVPSAGSPEENMQLDELLAGYDKIVQDATKSQEEKSLALGRLNEAVKNPSIVPKPTAGGDVIVQGWTDGKNRIVVDQFSGDSSLVPEHRTMFYDPEKVKELQNVDELGNVAFKIPANGIRPAEFGIGQRRPQPPDPNQPTLPEQQKAVSFAPLVNQGPQNAAVYGRELSVHDAFRDIRAKQPLTQEDVPLMQEMGLKAQQIHQLRIGENIPKSSDPILNLVQGVVNVDSEGKVVRLGNTDVAKAGVMEETRFAKTTQLPKEVVAGMKEMYPEAWHGGNVDVNALVSAMRERPMVTTRRLDVGNTDGNATANAIHQLENEGFSPVEENGTWSLENEDGDVVAYENLTPEQQRLLDSLYGSTGETEGANEESATGRFSTVNPYPNDVLRGMKEVAPGEKITWAGDITGNLPQKLEYGKDGRPPVRVEHRGESTGFDEKGGYLKEPVRFTSQHYPSDAGKNQLFFVRGALHEYAVGAKLPDETVATVPRKVFEVWEMQSDWAAHVARDAEQLGPDATPQERAKRSEDISTPLLSHWESLALASAVQHARELGADGIVLSDAASAMMTEGHDKVARYAVVNAETGDEYSRESTAEQAQQIIDNLNRRVPGDQSKPNRYKLVENKEPAQSPGMTAAYDERGPKTLEKITGTKGKSVVMGEHAQAAVNEREPVGQVYSTEAQAREELRRRGVVGNATELSDHIYERQEAEGGGFVIKEDQRKGSPVFKEGGKAKSTNSGRLYSLDKIAGGLSLDDTLSIKEAVHAYDMAKQRETAARQRENNMAKATPEEMVTGVDKEKLKTHLDAGLSSEQALQVENSKANTLEVDAAQVEQEVARSQARGRFDSRERTKLAEHAVTDAEGNRLNFPTRSKALEGLESHAAGENRDPDDWQIVNAGRNRGYYLVEKLNRHISLDIQDSGGHERVATQAEMDEERVTSNEPSTIDEHVQTEGIFDALRKVTPVTFAGPGGDVAEAVSTLKTAHSGLDKIERNEAPTPEELSAIRELRAFYHGKRSFALGSSVPHDVELANEIGLHERGPIAGLEWLVKELDPKSYVRSLVSDLIDVSRNSLNTVKFTVDPEHTFSYLPAVGHLPAEINIPNLPVNRASAVQDMLSLAHEVAHHVTKDLVKSNDPKSVEFRKTLDGIREAILKGNNLPKSVVKAVRLAIEGGELEKYRKSQDYSLYAWYEKNVGKGNRAFFKIFYGLLDHDELIAKVFDAPEMVSLLANTRVKNATFVGRALDWFSRAWKGLIGSNIGIDNALAELLTGFSEYIGKPKAYNGLDFIRDRLVVRGARAEGLASRVYSVKNMLKTGTLEESVAGWVRENTAGILPTTVHYGDPAVDVRESPNVIASTILALPKEYIPAHRDLWQRLQQDSEVAREYDKRVGGLGEEVKRNLAESAAKVNAMKRAILRYERDIQREESLDNFDPSGWRRSLDGRLRNSPTPEPADPVGNLELAQSVMGLRAPERTTEEVRTAEGEKALKKGVGDKVRSFFEKNFLLRQHFAQIHPADAARSDVLGMEAAKATNRMTGLHVAYNFDPEVGHVSERIIQNNLKVKSTERLLKPASEIRLAANEIVKQNVKDRLAGNLPGPEVSWDHPEVRRIVRHLNAADQESLRLNFDAWKQRWDHNVKVMWPDFYDDQIPTEIAATIAARERVLPDSAKTLAESYYNSLKSLQDPQQAPGAMEMLRQLATQVSPATSLKVIEQLNAAMKSAQDHVDFLASRSHYTSEQRYGKFLARMKDSAGKSIMVDGNTEKELNGKVEAEKRKGSKFVDFIQKDDTNVGGASQDVYNKIEELEQQRQQRMAAALDGVDAQTKAELMSQDSLATELRTSIEAMKPLPGVTRKFVNGRETLNLLDNDDQFYLRQNNYMRHKLTRAGDRLARLHPEVAGNTELKKFGDQMLEAFLTPDNEIARRLTSATFFYKLAFEFGNNFLESFQHLTTGMQALISETGSVADALDVTRKATKDYWTAKTTGKWANEDQAWLVKQMTAFGHDVAGDWYDIHDPDSLKLRAMNDGKGIVGRSMGAVNNLSRSWSSKFQRYGNFIGMLSGFEISKAKGMDNDAAFKYAVDSKNLGMYTGGKAQRGGVWRIKTKAVPQLMTSLQTYTMGWFGQMYGDYVKGFSKNRPSGLSRAQIEGSKKAFLYGLAAQATLAGALGLPGIGQGMALLQQGTGVDLKGWVRGHLQSLFDEDQEGGGLISGLALNGVLAGVSPFDPSNRANMSIPFTGVDTMKGFSVANLAGAPGATLEDFAKGMMSLASGDMQGAVRMLPNMVKRPARLLMDDGDVRDKRGGLLYEMSPAERAMTLAGLPPTRIQRARDVAEAARRADLRATAKQEALADSLAKMFTEQGPQAVQQKLLELKTENPDLDLVSLVKSVGTRRQRQLTPYDWRREVNPAAELQGLSVHNPSTVALGRQIQSQTTSALGLQTRPNPRADAEAVAIDHLLNSGAARTEAEARKMLQRSGHRQQLAIPGI